MTILEAIAKLGEMICLLALWCLFMKRGMDKDPNLYYVCICMMGFDVMKRHALDDPISMWDKVFIWLFAFIIVVNGIERLHTLWRRRRICRRNIKRLIAKF